MILVMDFCSIYPYLRVTGNYLCLIESAHLSLAWICQGRRLPTLNNEPWFLPNNMRPKGPLNPTHSFLYYEKSDRDKVRS